MPLVNTRPIIIKPIGLTDSLDGTNSFPGGMASLQNLVPAPTTRSLMVPRPASTQITAFSGFNTPAQGEALLVVGTTYYGMIASARFTNHSEPFAYDSVANAFLAVSGVTAANTPNTLPSTGGWEPPQMAQVGGRVLVAHIGFDGTGNFFGWLDLTGFSDTTRTGDTHGPGNPLVDNLSADVLQAGWRPGQVISNGLGDFAANTRIVTVAANGLSITVDPPALLSNAGTPLSVTGGSVSAPLWCAGNTNGFPLLGVPVAVAQFSGRAWYAYNAGASGAPALGTVAFSDAGDPLQITNATAVQVITFQNGLRVTALAGLPLNNQLGGIIQALMVFQGAGNIQQITGDQSTSNLAVNSLNEAVGTLAPNSIAPTPMGLMFMAPDGLRIINFQANISPPIGMNGDGLAYPFVNAVYPSRMAAAYNEDVYRCSIYGNLSAGGIEFNNPVWQDFWYHVKLKSWSGPHTFPPAVIKASQTTLGFVLFPVGSFPIGLWSSDTLPRVSSIYVENSIRLACVYQTVLEPDNAEMAENSVVQSSIMISVPLEAGEATVSVINESFLILDTVTIPGIGSPSSEWGTMIWGAGKWGGATILLEQRRIPWKTLLTFKQASVVITIPAYQGVGIGNLYIRHKVEGYLMQGLPDNP